METLELLEVEKSNTELVIQELHNTANLLEDNRNLKSQKARETTEKFLREIGIEINWNECILQEINGSIDFEDSKRE